MPEPSYTGTVKSALRERAPICPILASYRKLGSGPEFTGFHGHKPKVASEGHEKRPLERSVLCALGSFNDLPQWRKLF